MKINYMKSLLTGCSLCSALLAWPAFSQDWQLPRTEYGHPDLQGIWSNATQTRLERNPDLGEQRAFTEEQALSFEARSRAAQERGNQDSDPDRAPPTDGNTAAAYNSFWLERGNEIVRINGEYRTSMIIEPANGRIPYLPEAERQASQVQQWLARPGVGAFDGPELQTIGERCLLFWDFRTSNSSAGPPMMPMIYNNNYQIVQNRDYVVIYAEMMHDARIIRLQGQHQPAEMIKWMGDSVGYWEGDTLVVETRNMHPQQSHFGSSPAIVITERFTRSSDSQIDYQFTMNDPAVYSQPWTAEMAMRQRPEIDAIYEYACHEGNYALSGILAGARRQELDGDSSQ